jgi:hypothetical protein
MLFFCWRIWSLFPFLVHALFETWKHMDLHALISRGSQMSSQIIPTAEQRRPTARQLQIKLSGQRNDCKQQARLCWHWPSLSFPPPRRDYKGAMMAHGRLMAKLLTFCEEKKMTEITQVRKKIRFYPQKGLGAKCKPNISLSRACGCPSLCLSYHEQCW